jgi:methylated-DNA-protein-cysteine methyltransferase related protein
MKAKSPFFARIQADVYAIVRSVPPGRVVTYSDIGSHLDVMPRHVAYLQTMHRDATDGVLTWHRVVPADGVLKLAKGRALGSPAAQWLQSLQAEGITIGADGQIANLAKIACKVADLNHGVAKQTRPATAPIAKAKPQRNAP